MIKLSKRWQSCQTTVNSCSQTMCITKCELNRDSIAYSSDSGRVFSVKKVMTFFVCFDVIVETFKLRFPSANLKCLSLLFNQNGEQC